VPRLAAHCAAPRRAAGHRGRRLGVSPRAIAGPSSTPSERRNRAQATARPSSACSRPATATGLAGIAPATPATAPEDPIARPRIFTTSCDVYRCTSLFLFPLFSNSEPLFIVLSKGCKNLTLRGNLDLNWCCTLDSPSRDF
jgi:hypothetical protein